MSNNEMTTFNDGDRVTHAEKGLGTVRNAPEDDNLVVAPKEEAKTGRRMVYVVWDDDRFPVGKIDATDVEAVPDAAAAISSGV